jgi:aspartoacylase
MHSLLEFFQRQNDGDDVQEELSKIYPIGSVPCFRTAPARRPGEISGKITWPCDPDNPNFPTLMVHESLQDQDFAILRVDDPLFVAPDGSITHYDGSHGTFFFLAHKMRSFFATFA